MTEQSERLTELNERILPDDYPIYGDYFYLADGKVYRSDWHGITVRELKAREGFKEVRNCDWRRYNGTTKQIEDLVALKSSGGE